MPLPMPHLGELCVWIVVVRLAIGCGQLLRRDGMVEADNCTLGCVGVALMVWPSS